MKQKFTFEKLQLSDNRSWIQRIIQSPKTRQTLLFMLMGAVFSGLYYLISIEFAFEKLITQDLVKSMIVGALFGGFIVNSPCARGKCSN